MTVLRFTLPILEDLSARPDFTFDVMAGIRDEIRKVAEDSPEMAALRQRASVEVNVTGSLTQIELAVRVTRLPDAEAQEGELDAARKAIGERLRAALPEAMGGIMQGAVDAARRRM